MTTRTLSSLAPLLSLALMASACGGGSGDENESIFSGSASATLTTTLTSGETTASTGMSGDGDGDGSSGDGDGDPASGDGDGDASTSGVKLDTLPAETSAGDGPMDENCDFVDLLFVIDNSVSMGGYQAALGLAFPQFANTLTSVLPSGVNVHVGVTSSEMGYAASGSTSIFNGMCTFEGDGMPGDTFYVTPDMQNTGKNGAQGRLFDPGGGEYYFDFNTDDLGQLAALEAWFDQAAAIGTGGSNIEMTLAPAGWAMDMANDATNSGFVRDEGAVLVVFFMTDEPDQTPVMIGNQTGGQFILDMVASAKAGCGGLDCVIGGGFLEASACEDQPLDEFLAGLPDPAQVAPLPDDNLPPQQAADQMNELLADTLADAIAGKCDEISPVE